MAYSIHQEIWIFVLLYINQDNVKSEAVAILLCVYKPRFGHLASFLVTRNRRLREVTFDTHLLVRPIRILTKAKQLAFCSRTANVKSEAVAFRFSIQSYKPRFGHKITSSLRSSEMIFRPPFDYRTPVDNESTCISLFLGYILHRELRNHSFTSTQSYPRSG